MQQSTLLLPLLLLLATNSARSQPFDYPAANLSTIWTNDESLKHNVSYPDGSTIRALLLRGSFGQSFAFGFYCSTSSCTSFILCLCLVYTNSGSYITKPMQAPPQVLWSPNRSRPVREKASLHLTSNGDLILYDADSTVVWSTNTSGLAVSGLNLTLNGNLILFNRNNIPVWQSFDHLTDTLIVGQSLKLGQRLTANSSTTNSTESSLYFTLLSDGLSAFIDSNPPQMYYHSSVKGSQNITYSNGSLVFSPNGESISLPSAPSMQYMRFEFDGHLKVYSWTDASGWSIIGNVFAGSIVDDCGYPTVCGAYGICSGGQCSCPANGSTPFFDQVDGRQPNLGCKLKTPLSCQALQNHQLLTLNNVSYFNYVDSSAKIHSIKTEAACKLACLTNCPCKAAFFQYGGDISDGSCYLLTQVFSMRNNVPDVSHYNSSAYIKVQVNPSPPSLTTGERSSNLAIILGSVFGGLVVVSLVACIVLVVWRRKMASELEEDDEFDQVPGMPARFSFEELRIATENFSKKLGQGGFGSVFEGELADGVKVAVKRLDEIGQGKKEFLAEVQTIGSIHHIKLVRLIGFCAEKTYRLLVYEYMPNGSLDKWIFHASKADDLDWNTRRRIITDIAKGLSYLHEECRQRIAHLDIKPQNILLDEHFNAKVSDFGLSKLIDREQSQVMTRMRGTPGYLAPEWLTSIITEKVDIYSFGVVVMEIVCGRKNLDYSQPEESMHLVRQLQKFIQESKVEDLVDSHSHDMQLHKKEVVEIIWLAMWCLQADSSRRPLMSEVVKVLEGSISVEHELDFDFLSSTPAVAPNAKYWSDSAPMMDSVLSGPR
ncbi:G-type lectin S-receptor-like serine/threonine-protein kinase SD2-5 [Dioscorea cayenensis subsp. rotundata]|uniref:Receptor-like serine/threonine-protein kinase n=1 Tax=Dioscorea cayennensis subsp. rotundata TaxID=55577 RepID=A0AB40CTJ5_DIOCR|nr:G-type lectin S-receptor-like serine/threonine-protein kinase SD2-5 [Dioscorea cayenensis subsp. rotundata]